VLIDDENFLLDKSKRKYLEVPKIINYIILPMYKGKNSMKKICEISFLVFSIYNRIIIYRKKKKRT